MQQQPQPRAEYKLRDPTGKPIPPYPSRGYVDPIQMQSYQEAMRAYNAQQAASAAAVAAAAQARTQGSITQTALKFAGKPSIQPVKQDNIAGPTATGAITAQRPQPGNPQVQQPSIAGSMRRRGRKFSLGAVLDSSDALGA